MWKVAFECVNDAYKWMACTVLNSWKKCYLLSLGMMAPHIFQEIDYLWKYNTYIFFLSPPG